MNEPGSGKDRDRRLEEKNMSKAAAPPEGADDVGGTIGDSTGDLQ